MRNVSDEKCSMIKDGRNWGDEFMEFESSSHVGPFGNIGAIYGNLLNEEDLRTFRKGGYHTNNP
jgi:hypothetical protein